MPYKKNDEPETKLFAETIKSMEVIASVTLLKRAFADKYAVAELFS